MVKMHSKIHTCRPETVPLIASFWRRGNERRIGKRLLFNNIQSKRGNQWDSFWLAPMNHATHFDGSKTVGFQFPSRATSRLFQWICNLLEGTSRSVNLLTLLTRSLKAKWCNFLRENCSGAGALSKQEYLPCPSIIRNRKGWTQNPPKSLENRFWGKRTTIYHR